MITVVQKGDFSPTLRMLKYALSQKYLAKLDSFGQRGVSALSIATPKDHGETASSWSYVIKRSPSTISINWTNSVDVGTAPLAVLLQYGHGTRNGGYVQGRDYINPAMRPIFDEIVQDAWSSLMNG
jgi:hypothetical protein